MTTVMTAGYIAATTVPIWHTRILYDQIARRDAASVSAFNESADSVLEAPINDQTFEWWEASSLPSYWTVDAGASVTINAVGIAVHDIGTQGATVQVQTSPDGVAWSSVAGASASPTTDAPIMILFTPTANRYWRLHVSGTTPPKIAIIYFGSCLELPQPVNWGGHSPAIFNPNITKRPSMSERGQRLGTTLIRGGFEARYEVDHLTELWVRNHFLPFTRAAWRYGYFISWRPADFPDEVLFGWTSDAISPDNSGPGLTPRGGATESDGRKMSCSWSMMAHGSHEFGNVPWGAL